MKKKIKYLLVCLLCLTNFYGQAQSSNPNFETTIRNIIPASPTAASLGQFGNIPINLSTGIPNIDIPIYQVDSRGIKVNVSLSYNAGGNKVESIASWVGLGWTLNVGGVITRSTQGIPDDAMNGYMTNQPRSVDFIIDNLSNPYYATEIDNYLRMAGAGTYDLEPDIYVFNFMGYSGKFYYDQKNNRFNLLPLQNFKIEYTASEDFIITTDNGFKYYFQAKEITTTSGAICVSGFTGANPGPAVTTVSSWFLTKVENPNNNETVLFQYSDYISSNETNFSRTKYILTSFSGSYAPGTNPPDYSTRTCNNGITISAKRLKTIVTPSCTIEFTPFNFDRCDVQGERALKQVEVFDKNLNRVKKVEFSYGYFGGPDDISTCQYSVLNRAFYLKLNSLSELSNDITLNKLTTSFEYSNTPIPYEGRFSYAQDFWGYFNNANNSDLIPPTFLSSSYAGMIYIPGANRKPDPVFAEFGILKKIKYPTGGYTEFTYESNSVADSPIPPEFSSESVLLEGDHIGAVSYYEKQFVINYGPNYYNGFNPNGGAFVSFDFGEIGCTFINNQASTCAILAINGLTPGTTGFTLTSNSQNIYLPNGTYKMSAQFSQNPAMFADFYFRALWKVPLIEQNRLTGGLRIKKIADYDGITSIPYNVQNFDYNIPGTTKSSGKLINLPNTYEANFQDVFMSTYCNLSCIDFELVRNFLKISSYTNSPLVFDHGSYVMYEHVKVDYYTNGQGGSREVKHKIAGDIVSTQFPYIHIGREWMRGAPLSESIYKWENGNRVKVEGTDYSYEEVDIATVPSRYSVRALKPAYTYTVSYGVNSQEQYVTPALVSQRISESLIPITEEYEIISAVEKVDTVKKSYWTQANAGNQNVLYTSDIYDYNKMQVSSVKTTNSTGEEIQTTYKYPYDYTDLVHAQMVSRNILTPVIEEVKKNNTLDKELARIKTNYSSVTATNSILPTSIQKSVNGNSLETELNINEYDDKGNIRQVTGRDGVITAYIWGYNQQYPVAKIIGKTYADVIAQSAVNLSVINYPTSEAALRTELDKLRSLAGSVLVYTYTYFPLLGISSETDANGKTIYYKYDSFNRLRQIKDKDYNVIKVFDYQYQVNP